MTTRLLMRFSCTARFMASILISMARKRGWPIFINITSTTASTGMAIRKISARCGEMVKAITVAIASMMGERLTVRRS